MCLICFVIRLTCKPLRLGVKRCIECIQYVICITQCQYNKNLSIYLSIYMVEVYSFHPILLVALESKLQES